MSKKEEKKEPEKDPKKGAKEPPAPLTPEQEAAKSKKKKLIMFGAIGLLVIGGGAFAAMKMLGGSSKPKDEHATETPEGHDAEGHEAGDKPEADPHADPHAETKKDDGHGEAKKDDGHGGGDGHGEAKKDDGHSEAKKDDGHGEAKKDDGHGGGDGHGEAKKDDGHGGGDSKTSSEPARYTGIGLMYDFKPFHLNLGNPLENRYVRMEVRLEYPNEEQGAELKARDSQLRDAIVSIISRKTREHLLSPDGKDQLRLEIKNRVNQYLEKKIVNVYITDILIE